MALSLWVRLTCRHCSLLLEDPLGFYPFVHVSLKGVNRQEVLTALRFKANLRKRLDLIHIMLLL